MFAELRNIRVVICAVIMVIAVSSQGQLRKVKIGDKMPEFTLPDANKVSDTNDVGFEYKYNSKKILTTLDTENCARTKPK